MTDTPKEIEALVAYLHDRSEGQFTSLRTARVIEAADALTALQADRDRAQRKFELAQRAKDVWLPCPDHRDKREPGQPCQVCAKERVEAENERLREALRLALGAFENFQASPPSVFRRTTMMRSGVSLGRILDRAAAAAQYALSTGDERCEVCGRPPSPWARVCPASDCPHTKPGD